ncbi:type II toxin-antitoxin system YoeB family toxin [Candidatus Peregrinibacteria bacterium]|nr:type II toxin-antitoxin system YoeB family toxin [Candidatus Peregrinibacteria bacterium]
MAKYEIFFSKQALKDIKTLPPKLKAKLKMILLEVIGIDPYCGKRLVGELAGNYSYRLSLKDRIVYSVDKDAKHIYIKRAKTHYGD